MERVFPFFSENKHSLAKKIKIENEPYTFRCAPRKKILKKVWAHRNVFMRSERYVVSRIMVGFSLELRLIL